MKNKLDNFDFDKVFINLIKFNNKIYKSMSVFESLSREQQLKTLKRWKKVFEKSDPFNDLAYAKYKHGLRIFNNYLGNPRVKDGSFNETIANRIFKK